MNNLANKNVRNLINFAQVNKDNGKLLEAKILLKKAIKLDAKNELALNNLANIYKETKDFDQSIKYYLKSNFVNPSYKVSKINLAILYHEIGKLDEAQKTYKEIIKIDKFNFEVYFKLSEISFEYFSEEVIYFIENSLRE